MKPVLEYLPRNADESFVTRGFDYHFFPTPWHFHPEYELVLVTESTGKRFIGDKISNFEPGDLALIGSYLPHNYKNDAQYYAAGSTLRAKSIVVHFREDSFGENFFSLPEAQKISSLLGKSLKGLDITGKTNLLISEMLYTLIDLQGLARWLLFVNILNILADSKELTYICPSIITGQNQLETDRMNKIINFVIKNFNREIHLSEAAEIANMAKNSFSRYFSQRTKKTFTNFVNEVRLNRASGMLIKTNKSVIEISMDCGFNNLSNFNRQFRKIYNQSPLTFKKMFYDS